MRTKGSSCYRTCAPMRRPWSPPPPPPPSPIELRKGKLSEGAYRATTPRRSVAALHPHQALRVRVSLVSLDLVYRGVRFRLKKKNG